jgi:uncharacterized protein YyaL (SSP411 family)
MAKAALRNKKMANRLQQETSPYLLQHAENPVDWYPWGPEALDLAKRMNKPIFLSIGYAACHWCHVMAHESFEDTQTAELMNSYFINIKVDREERPDVDNIYMNAVIAITGRGGWPLSMFLTPEGKPFYGGTYFPPTRRYNMPSFQEVLQYLHEQWENNRESVLKSGEELTQQLHPPSTQTSDDLSLDQAILDQAAKKLFKEYDWQDGGWGGAPKFPASSTIETLMLRYHRTKDQLALDMASHALGHMRRGGIHDQIGGGFHRYAVDGHWLVPHFEKMLYDNALLLRAYLHHWQITQEQQSLDVVEQIIAFLVREMKHERGGYFSSLDADSEGEEGTFYVWDLDELNDICSLSPYPEFAAKAFGVTQDGNIEGKNVLSQPLPLVSLANEFGIDEDEARTLIQDLRDTLFKARANRTRPATDDKIITAWNGLVLIALAEAARALARSDILTLAQELAEFILTELTRDSKLYRSWRNGEARYTAYLEDHAALGLGLIALYQADFNTKWLSAARVHASEILQHFSDEQGGFFDTRDDHEALIARPKTIQDSPTPSGNSLAITLFLLLAALDGDGPWIEPALKALSPMQETARRHPSAFAGWLNALDFVIGPQLQLAITGDAENDAYAALLKVSDQSYLPRLVRAAGDPGEKNAPQLLMDRESQVSDPTAFLCQGFTCQLPTQSPDTLQQQIESALSGPGN